MRPEIESARLRLQTILCQLEQCCADEETFSPQLVQEAHALVRLLHHEGYDMATIRQTDSRRNRAHASGKTCCVIIEP